jgi:integrase
MASTPGIRVRHGRSCRSGKGGRCNCEPTYEAWVWSNRDKKKIRRSFPTASAARGWRTDASKLVRDKKLRAPTSRTLRQEVDEWLAGARDGRILNKRAERYKPSVVRNYETALRLRVLPTLGDRKLADIDLADLLELKEQLLGEGHSGSTIRNSFVPLQAIYRRARRNGLVAVNPAVDLDLPTAGRRDRAATPSQADELLAVLPDSVRPLWAVAFYAGLRRGEMRALRIRDVDFDARTIRVERSWDAKEGPVAPKSRAGTRTVFMLDSLVPFLEPLRDRWSDPDSLFFGPAADQPFEPRAVERKAQRALTTEDERRKKEAEKSVDDATLVVRFTFHEARHSFSTWLDAAGISETRADRYMGHSDGGVAGRYRHPLPGQIAADAQLVDDYLVGSVTGKVVELKRPAVG